MLYSSDIIPISDLDCTLHFPNGDTEDFILEAPNGSGMFNYSIQEIQQSLYRDANRVRRKGFRERKIILEFNYSSHYMDLSKLLVSSYIEINFGNFQVPFLNTEFVLDQNSVTKNWFSNNVIAKQDTGFKNVNIVPSGETTLSFLSMKNSQRFGITSDTELNIYFDSSGSMDTTLQPLTTMRDEILKDRLIDVYNGDSTLYDSKVSVIEYAGERTFEILQNGDHNNNPVLNIIFQDEAAPVYHPHPIPFDDTQRTAEYESDISALRSKMENAPVGNFRALIFKVDSDETEKVLSYEQFLKAVQEGSGAYEPPYGLSDKNSAFIRYNIIAASEPEYYADLIMNNL